LFPASKAISNHGEVIGIDISKGMIEKTHQEIIRRKTDNAQAMVMDAERLEFPNSQFDYVLCGLCLFFFPNLGQALKEIFRVLKPGGFIVSSTFKREKADALTAEWKKLYESFKDRIADVPQAETTSLDMGRDIKKELLEVGFVNPEFTIRRKTFYCKDENEWWQTAWSHGYRSYLERIPTELLPEFKSGVFKIIRKKDKGRGISLIWELILSKARKPSIV
jgi:SAM-dependent methyltransferase